MIASTRRLMTSAAFATALIMGAPWAQAQGTLSFSDFGRLARGPIYGVDGGRLVQANQTNTGTVLPPFTIYNATTSNNFLRFSNGTAPRTNIAGLFGSNQETLNVQGLRYITVGNQSFASVFGTTLAAGASVNPVYTDANGRLQRVGLVPVTVQNGNPVFGTGSFGSLLAMNATGAYTGFSSNATGASVRAFRGQIGGGVSDLGVLPTGGRSQGVAINAGGTVAGWSDTRATPGAEHAVTFDASTNAITDLHPGAGYSRSQSVAINDAGAVAGFAFGTVQVDGRTRSLRFGFVRANGQTRVFGYGINQIERTVCAASLGDVFATVPSAIDANGNVYGVIQVATPGGASPNCQQPFVYNIASQAFVNLGLLPSSVTQVGTVTSVVVNGVNRFGQMALTARLFGTPNRSVVSDAGGVAVLYIPGRGFVDLNQTLRAGTSFGASVPSAINQIQFTNTYGISDRGDVTLAGINTFNTSGTQNAYFVRVTFTP